MFSEREISRDEVFTHKHLIIKYFPMHKGVVNVHPFKDFSPDLPEPKQLYLTREELDKLMNTTFDTPNRNFTRDMFLFSTFTGICYCEYSPEGLMLS